MTEKRGERQRQRDNKRQKQRKRESSIHWYAPQMPTAGRNGSVPSQEAEAPLRSPMWLAGTPVLEASFPPS